MTAYWKPEPRQHSFAWWALLLPAIAWFTGVIFYAHNALVPGMAQENGHAIGSALMVIGGESGTLAAAAEVFRKHAEGGTVALDWIGMGVSLIATLGNLLVVYVALAVHLQAPWIEPVRQWGPLVLLLCSGLDFYAGIMEFGFFNASFNARWIAWNDGQHAWMQMQETRKAKQSVLEIRTSETESETASSNAPLEIAESEDAQTESEAQAHVCELCGRYFGSVQALSAHRRFCSE